MGIERAFSSTFLKYKNTSLHRYIVEIPANRGIEEGIERAFYRAAPSEPNFLIPDFSNGYAWKFNVRIGNVGWITGWFSPPSLSAVIKWMLFLLQNGMLVGMFASKWHVWRICSKTFWGHISEQKCHLTAENPRKTLRFRPKNWALDYQYSAHQCKYVYMHLFWIKCKTAQK